MSKAHTHSMVLKHKEMEEDKANFIGFLRRTPFLCCLKLIQRRFSSPSISIEYSITLKAFGLDELDLKIYHSESLPQYILGEKKIQWWALLQMKQQFTERTLKSEYKHLCAKPLCLMHPFWKAVVIYTWEKNLHCFFKNIVWKYPIHICQWLQDWCTQSALPRIFCRSSTLENIWGRHIGMIWKYISFTLFFPDDPVAEPQHVPVWEFWNGLDGNRSVNIADSKCWWGALPLVLCLKEGGLHTAIKEEWGI